MGLHPNSSFSSLAPPVLAARRMRSHGRAGLSALTPRAGRNIAPVAAAELAAAPRRPGAPLASRPPCPGSRTRGARLLRLRAPSALPIRPRFCPSIPSSARPRRCPSIAGSAGPRSSTCSPARPNRRSCRGRTAPTPGPGSAASCAAAAPGRGGGGGGGRRGPSHHLKRQRRGAAPLCRAAAERGGGSGGRERPEPRIPPRAPRGAPAGG